jgi:long-chain acyl-CoA synthetase
VKGYWGKPEETAKVLTGEFLRTGDVATMDKDGFIFIVDRIKDLILVNGYNVYPRNIEEAIYMHPCVEECIVAGVPDDQRGEVPKAWIKLKADRQLNTEELKEFLRDKLSPIEMPRHIEFRDHPLPKTMIGKLSRKDILAEDRAQLHPL